MNLLLLPTQGSDPSALLGYVVLTINWEPTTKLVCTSLVMSLSARKAERMVKWLVIAEVVEEVVTDNEAGELVGRTVVEICDEDLLADVLDADFVAEILLYPLPPATTTPN